MTTTNYAIVTVFNLPERRGNERHYTEVRTYEYLEDARDDIKHDSVSVHKEAEEAMNRYEVNNEPYHLEVVKLRWSGNYSEVAKSYTPWFN